MRSAFLALLLVPLAVAQAPNVKDAYEDLDNQARILANAQLPGALQTIAEVVDPLMAYARDMDSDGVDTHLELQYGSHVNQASSRDQTDDDGDGQANEWEEQPRGLCTGAYGIVASPLCGGYEYCNGFVCTKGSSTFAWDAVCTTSLNSCRTTSRYIRDEAAPMELPRDTDGWGWRRIAAEFATRTVTLPTGNSTDQDRDGIPSLQVCDRTITVSFAGWVTSPPSNCRYIAPDPNDADPDNPVPDNVIGILLNETQTLVQNVSMRIQEGLSDLVNASQPALQIVLDAAALLQGILAEAQNSTVPNIVNLVELARNGTQNAIDTASRDTQENANATTSAAESLSNCSAQATTQLQAELRGAAIAYAGNANASQFIASFDAARAAYLVRVVECSGQNLPAILQAALDVTRTVTNATLTLAVTAMQHAATLVNETAHLFSNTSREGAFILQQAAQSGVQIAVITSNTTQALRDLLLGFLQGPSLTNLIKQNPPEPTSPKPAPQTSTTQTFDFASNSLQGSDARAFLFILVAALVGAGIAIHATGRR